MASISPFYPGRFVNIPRARRTARRHVPLARASPNFSKNLGKCRKEHRPSGREGEDRPPQSTDVHTAAGADGADVASGPPARAPPHVPAREPTHAATGGSVLPVQHIRGARDQSDHTQPSAWQPPLSQQRNRENARCPHSSRPCSNSPGPVATVAFAIQAMRESCHLTQRETEVLMQVCLGHKNSVIANALGVTTATVRLHLMNLHRKTMTADKVELVLSAWRAACAAGCARCATQAPIDIATSLKS